MATLDTIVAALLASPAVAEKVAIRRAYEPALRTDVGAVRVGDDCAAIPDGAGGYLLLASEGMRPEFVASDPWFAGYCAVMVNASDVAAMGGRPVAIVDVLAASSATLLEPVWEGMIAASTAYGVPVVGGHTTAPVAGPVSLSAAILGRAEALLSSFAARPGDALLMAVDLDGAFREDKPFWNASTGRAPDHLRAQMALLPHIAERGWSRAAKDISNGGVVGTLAMLLACSGVGARLDLGALPRPAGVGLARWLLAFPSFGFLLTARADAAEDICQHFSGAGVACAVVGSVTRDRALVLRLGGDSRRFWTEPCAGAAHA